MSDALRSHRHGETPQAEQARPDQVKNSAGGYTFQVSDHARLNRFLTLGTDGGTFYVSEKKLTRQNAKLVTGLAETSNPLLIDQAVKISQEGRAPRNNAALFAMAAAAGLGDKAYRQRALDLMPRVARTGTHFLTFAEYVEMFRGWGPQLVKGMRSWYLDKTPEDLAYQLLKYKQRDGWSQRDILRLCLNKSAYASIDAQHKALFAYVMKGEYAHPEHLPELVRDAEHAHKTRDVRQWIRLIEGNRSLSWEMLPSEALAEADVWRAMIASGNLPLGALLRNLARLTKLGVLKPLDDSTNVICGMLVSGRRIKKARIHPIAVLLALKTYAQGYSERGKAQWIPVAPVIDALNTMFYLAFGNVEPAGKQTAVCLDVSGSMNGPASGTSLSCMEAAVAMAMVTVRTEPSWAVMAFDNGIRPISISAHSRLDDALRGLPRNYGGTDCSLPMIWAQQQNLAVDTFQVYTDNETWAGQMHPHEALKRYRAHSGINARLQVIGMTATDFTIADPLDPGSLDVAGFDSAVPNLLASHARGDI